MENRTEPDVGNTGAIRMAEHGLFNVELYRYDALLRV